MRPAGGPGTAGRGYRQAPPLSPAEEATVARFEAAEPAPESYRPAGPLDLSALEQAHAAATPGEWSVRRSAGTGTEFADAGGDSCGSAGLSADAAAIVAAHNALPALLAAARRLDALVAAVETLAGELDEEASGLVRVVRSEPADSLARKYVTGRVTSLQEAAARLRAVLAGAHDTDGTAAR